MLYQCYVIPCYAMSRSFSFLSAPKSAILTSLFFVGFISPAPLHLPSTVARSLLAPTTPYFFQRLVSLFQRCYSTTFSMSLFKDFVQRLLPFFKSSLLFPTTFCFQVLCSMFDFMFPSVFKDLFQRVCSRSLTYCVMILFFTYFSHNFQTIKNIIFHSLAYSSVEPVTWQGLEASFPLLRQVSASLAPIISSICIASMYANSFH